MGDIWAFRSMPCYYLLMFCPQLRDTVIGDRFADFRFKVGLPLAIVFLGGLIFWVTHTRQRFAEVAQADWREKCGLQRPAQECERSLEAYHEACFRLSYSPSDGSYLHETHFKYPRYRACLELGPDGWRKQRREERAARTRQLQISLP